MRGLSAFAYRVWQLTINATAKRISHPDLAGRKVIESPCISSKSVEGNVQNHLMKKML